MTTPALDRVISPEELATIGRALFGAQWQSALARELDVSERSMRYLAAGQRRVHEGFARDLVKILEVHRDELRKLATAMKKRLG